MIKDIPACAQGIYITSENVVWSLTCNDLDLSTAKTVSAAPLSLGYPTLLPSEDPPALVSEEGLDIPELTPKRASWLLSGMILMGFDSYFLWVSAASSLWTPLQAAMSVLYWMASWWILPPGWKPNLVSLAPLSHRGSQTCLIGTLLAGQACCFDITNECIAFVPPEIWWYHFQ
ncbi:hypothetical protein DSO57_1028116 [Entomophthora muscae]|uniref:Uncharacterized protein n=1 Tax=Entomophthora muscae TaxID=34485 RepID=A0ACC2UB55_9FUNG|nr:hypothetical protein DSO57_1028116 [Entomophthora muscae]